MWFTGAEVVVHPSLKKKPGSAHVKAGENIKEDSTNFSINKALMAMLWKKKKHVAW